MIEPTHHIESPFQKTPDPKASKAASEGPTHNKDAPSDRRFGDGRPRPVALALVLCAAGEPGLYTRPLLPVARDMEVVHPLSHLLSGLGEVPWIQGTAIVAKEGQDAVVAEAARLSVRCLSLPDQHSSPLFLIAGALRELQSSPEQPVVVVYPSSPLLCPEVVSATLETLLSTSYEFVTTDLGSSVLPQGLDVEASFARVYLDLAELEMEAGSDTHRGGLFYRQSLRIRIHELSPVEIGPQMERSGRYYSSFQLALKKESDFDRIQRFYRLLLNQRESRALGTLLRLLDQDGHGGRKNPASPGRGVS